VRLNRTIKKILIIAVLVLAGSGMTVLLVAANGREEKKVCKDLVVTIKGESENFYIDKHDIIGGLRYEAGGKLVNRPIEEIDLAKLETQLEKSSWIRDAELYFDSRNVLHVIVHEREPIARVFTTAGRSFYIDSSGVRLPLLEKVSVRVPVVTNFTDARKLSAADSLVLGDLKQLARYVNGSEFWSAQVAQVDIVGERSYEIIPTVGNHIIRIGNAEQLEQKFHRLMVYYQKVATKVGLDKYRVLDAQFDGQVLGIHKGDVSVVDSIQLQKNIKELMERSQLQAEANQPMEMTAADATTEKPVAAPPPVETKQATDPNPTNITTRQNPVPEKTIQSKPVRPVGEKSPDKKPKAVMPKRAVTNP
jgi:cell division protein FtsQ